MVEGALIVLGKAVARDGPIQCHVFLLGHRRAKIHRVFRSSLSAECHASTSDADQSLRLQMMLTELITGKYDRTLFSPPTDYHLQNPFASAPENSKVLNDLKPAWIKIDPQWAVPRFADRPQAVRDDWAGAHCSSRQEKQAFAALKADTEEASFKTGTADRGFKPNGK